MKFVQLVLLDQICSLLGNGAKCLWEDERKLRVTASNFGEVILLKQ